MDEYRQTNQHLWDQWTLEHENSPFAEVDNAWLQRGQIILDIVGETSTDLVERLAPEVLAKLLVDKSATFLRWRISGYALAHGMAAVAFWRVGLLLKMIWGKMSVKSGSVIGEQ